MIFFYKFGVEVGTAVVNYSCLLLLYLFYISIYFAGLSLDHFIDVWEGELEQFFNCTPKITPNES